MTLLAGEPERRESPTLHIAIQASDWLQPNLFRSN